MKKLEYTFTNDILFKLVFSRNKDLLKELVAVLLGIQYESITDFHITNPEMPPEVMGDKFCMMYFELPKVPKTISKDDKLKLWLSLFNADTEEELNQIEILEVAEMEQAIRAFRHVSATDEFRELERLRSRAKSNEASALGNARRKEREKWQGVVAEKDAEIEKLRKQLAEKG